MNDSGLTGTGSVENRLTRMETILDDLKRTLLGNGQPGVITNMEAKLSAKLSDMDERYTERFAGIEKKMETFSEFRWRLVGAFGVLTVLFSVIELVVHVFKKGTP